MKTLTITLALTLTACGVAHDDSSSATQSILPQGVIAGVECESNQLAQGGDYERIALVRQPTGAYNLLREQKKPDATAAEEVIAKGLECAFPTQNSPVASCMKNDASGMTAFNIFQLNRQLEPKKQKNPITTTFQAPNTFWQLQFAPTGCVVIKG